jgi:two-component system, response regulator PdtaR
MLFRKRKRKIKRILIVEDEPLVAFDNEVMLGDAGYHVVGTFDNYADAILLMEREPVDLVLSDITLAGAETGIDLAREAKSRGIAVLFVTGHPPEGGSDLAVGVLAKPYTDRTLRAALESVDRALCGKEPEPVAGLLIYTAPVKSR